jgi:chromosome segregation and condensation protein ScpB
MADRIISEFALTIQELPAVLEAILFASGDPVSLNRLVEITEIDRDFLRKPEIHP